MQRSQLFLVMVSLLLYYSSYCPHSQKVLRYLQSIHKTVPMQNVQASSEIRQEFIDRVGKEEARVPCLLIDKKALYGDETIIQWLGKNQHLLKDDPDFAH